MAVQVDLELIDGASMVDTGGLGGLTATAIAMVSGLVESTNERGQLYAALTANGVPQQYSAWPGFPANHEGYVPSLVCGKRTAEPVDNQPGTIRVICEYAPPGIVELTAGDGTEVQVGTSLTEVDTSFERVFSGTESQIIRRQIVLAHPFIWHPKKPGEKPPRVDEAYRGGQVVRVYDEGENKMVMVHQTGTVKVRIPTTTLTLIREQYDTPWDIARRFVGKTNRTPVFGDYRGYWLIAAITGQSRNGGLTYVTRYDFIYNPEKWFARVIFQDGETRQPVLNYKEEDDQNNYVDPFTLQDRPLSGIRGDMIIMEEVEFRDLDIIGATSPGTQRTA